MNLQRKTRIIQTICWTGVVADAIWIIALCYPEFYGYLTGREVLEVSLTLRLAMGVGASLMAGWTVLLAWTATKPIERRGVMLITALPVIAGLIIVTITGLINGQGQNIWLLAKCTFLFVAMLFGYHLANTIARETSCENCH